MPPAAIAGGLAAGAIGSGIAGAVSQNNATNAAKNSARKGQAAFQDLNLPRVSDMELQLEKYRQAGILTPELESSILQGNTNLKDIQTDPRLKQAQMDALDTLGRIGSSNGLDAQSQADLAASRMKTDASAAGARGALAQNFAARGMSGSGLEFAGDQMADQAAANTNALAGTQAAADASRRKMDALTGMSALAGSVRGQDYGQAQNAATAQDAIDRFNASNSQSVQSRNVASNNAAAAANLSEAQKVADQNVGLGNTQQQYNKELLQRNYDNQYKQAQGVAGQANNVANTELAGGKNLAGAFGGIGQTLAGAAGTVYANQDPTKKKVLP